jgi:hypothetical protein
VSGDVGRLSTAAQGKPVLRGLRKAIPRLLGCRCVEDEIVAEEEAVAGPGGPRSRPSRGATVTSTSTSMFSVTFTSIPSLSLLQLTWLLRISSVRLELGMLRAHGVSQSDHKKIARVSSMAAKVPLGDQLARTWLRQMGNGYRGAAARWHGRNPPCVPGGLPARGSKPLPAIMKLGQPTA